MSHFKSKKEKIAFLKEWKAGRRNILELVPAEEVKIPQRVEFWRHEGGAYINDSTGAPLTEMEFLNRPKRIPGIRHTVIFEDFGQQNTLP